MWCIFVLLITYCRLCFIIILSLPGSPPIHHFILCRVPQGNSHTHSTRNKTTQFLSAVDTFYSLITLSEHRHSTSVFSLVKHAEWTVEEAKNGPVVFLFPLWSQLYFLWHSYRSCQSGQHVIVPLHSNRLSSVHYVPRAGESMDLWWNKCFMFAVVWRCEPFYFLVFFFCVAQFHLCISL